MSEVISVGNVHQLDYDLLVRKRVAEFFGDSNLAYSTKKADIKAIDRISFIAERHNDLFYNLLTKWLKLWSGERERVFVRVNDFRIINKLKREYKRPNYITILLTPLKSELGSKFDLVIRTEDRVLFAMELKKFVKTKLYTMHFINTPKLKR
jgi:hypothetical protein